MQVDFWNNPLVVTAMRLKYRRSSPGLTTSVYMLVLLGLAFVVDYYRDSISIAPGLVFLVSMLSIQFLLSGGIAVFAVANSMSAEVANRTLDFQRIVSLSSREILLGKMLGEPAISYFFLLATIPFAVICWAQGSASAWSIVWFYINLITFTLMCAAIGLLHTLSRGSKASGKQMGSGSFLGWFIFVFAWFPMFLLNVARIQPDSWSAVAINLISPIGALMALVEGNPWDAHVSFWGYQVPSLFLAPIIHAVIATTAIAAMGRRLRNALDPLFSRASAYLALILLDLLLTGILYSKWLIGVSTHQLLFQYGLGHIIICLLLTMLTAPSRDGLISWVWRFQQDHHWLRDMWSGIRSMINAELAVFCCIGVLILLLGFILPINLSTSAANVTAFRGTIAEVLAVSSLLVLALGAAYQWCVATAGKSGILLFFVLLLLANIVPPILVVLLDGYITQTTRNALMGASPIAMLNSHATLSGQPLPLSYLFSVYGSLWVVFYVSLKRWLNRQRAIVARKKSAMSLS